MQWRHAILSVVLPIAAAMPWLAADAQSQHWDLHARDQAETLQSQALNFLNVSAKDPRQRTANLDTAISILVKASDADPTDSAPPETLGLALAMRGRFQEALDALAKSYKLAPDNNETMLSIALAQYLSRDFEKASDVLKRLMTHAPKLNAAKLYFAYVSATTGDLSTALRAFRSVTIAETSSQVSFHGLALTNMLAGNFLDAQSNADHALNLQQYPPTLALRAKIALCQGDKSGAAAFARKAIQEQKKDPQQRSMVSIGFAKKHDFRWDPFQLDDFFNPNLILARTVDPVRGKGKVKSFQQAGNLSDTLVRAQQAVSDTPNDAVALSDFANIQLAAGNYAAAIDVSRKLLNSCPSCHAGLVTLAYALVGDGQKQAAADAVRQFTKDHPDSPIDGELSELLRQFPAQQNAQTSPPLFQQSGNQQQQPKTENQHSGF